VGVSWINHAFRSRRAFFQKPQRNPILTRVKSWFKNEVDNSIRRFSNLRKGILVSQNLAAILRGLNVRSDLSMESS